MGPGTYVRRLAQWMEGDFGERAWVVRYYVHS